MPAFWSRRPRGLEKPAFDFLKGLAVAHGAAAISPQANNVPLDALGPTLTSEPVPPPPLPEEEPAAPAEPAESPAAEIQPQGEPST